MLLPMFSRMDLSLTQDLFRNIGGKRNADGGSVHGCTRLPRYQLIRETSAEQQRAGDSEIGHIPGYSIGDLHG